MNNDIILSFCLAGRNDDYGTNFKKRLQITLNYLAYNIFRLGYESKIEIVMVDWNSDFPLAEALTITPEATEIIRFVEVPRNMAELLNNANSKYSSANAENTSCRHARGQYVCFIMSDIIISLYALERLVHILEGTMPVCFDPRKAYLGIPRKYISESVNDDIFAADFKKLDKFIQLDSFYMEFNCPTPGINHSYGGLLAHRDIYDKFRGFNSKFTGWGYQDEDFGLRVNKFFPTVNMGPVGVYFYDYTPDAGARETKARRLNKYEHIDHVVNDENWGFGNIDLKESKAVFSGDTPSPLSLLSENELSNALMDSAFRHEIAYVRKNIPARHLMDFSAPAVVAGRIAGLGKTKKYLEISDRNSSGTLAVGLINQLSEIYILECAGTDEQNLFSYFSHISHSLFHVKHQGFVRMVTGCPAKGLERLEKSFFGIFQFDLILFKIISETKLEMLKRLTEIMASSGSIILCSEDVSLLKKAAAWFNDHASGFNIVVSECRKTAVVSKLEIDPSIAEKSIKAWKPFKVTWAVRLMALRGERWRRLKLLVYFLLQNRIAEWPVLLKYLRKRAPR